MLNYSKNPFATGVKKPIFSDSSNNTLGRRTEEEVNKEMIQTSQDFKTAQREVVKKNEQELENRRQTFADTKATYSKKPAGSYSNLAQAPQQPQNNNPQSNSQAQRDLMRNINRLT